jgi:glycerate 2-kinase
VGHLVAAPDKFRGTASAASVAEAAALGATRAGWTSDPCPMADGGEGLLEAVGGQLRSARVTGPDGIGTVTARWTLLDGGGTAVIEMAEAAGLTLAGGPLGNDPLRATTAGVGQLLLEAVRAGARRIVVGCGGSATTDGGEGLLEALGGGPDRLSGIELLVAVDVDTRFEQAAAVFGPQKGASPTEVEALTHRLEALADGYRRRFGVDVTSLPGSGAAGGLAGGLAALGARIVPGFDLVAELVDLPGRLARADAVMTGEGRLDATSLVGKVVSGVLRYAPASIPVLCVVGDADPSATLALPSRVLLARLVEIAGLERARSDVADLVADVVCRELEQLDQLDQLDQNA